MDPQAALLAELLDLLGDDRVELDALLGLVVERWAFPCGVVALRVVAHDDEARGDEARGDEARGDVVVPLRLFGEHLGSLVLTGPGARTVRADVLAVLAHHVAVVVQATGDRRARALEAAAAAAVRRLFEEGTRATTVREAGEVLARVTAQALGTERVAVHLIDADGCVHDLLDVGIPAGALEELRRQVVGRLAGDSPIWRRSQREGGPVLADDARAAPGRPGGFVETMRLRSYAAMPLLSAGGAVGMVVCGDVSAPRVWTERDRRVAHQLALEGALVVDSARLRQAERAHLAELQHRADHDALTGLPNRRRLLEALAEAMPSTPAAGGALLILDLDGFKQVNDTLGHHAGDELLREVAGRLRREVRAGDLAARLGGDEFAVLLPAASPEETFALARRLTLAVQAPVVVDGVPARVGVSVGLALLPDHGQDVAGLLRAADTAMYVSKRASRSPRPGR